MEEHKADSKEKVVYKNRFKFGTLALATVGVGVVYTMGYARGLQMGRGLGQAEMCGKAAAFVVGFARQAADHK